MARPSFAHLDEFDDDGNLTARWCNTHGAMTPADGFFRSKAKRAGYHINCKECQKVYHKTYYEVHKEEHIARTREWQGNNRERFLSNMREYAARKNEERKSGA